MIFGVLNPEKIWH